MLLCFFFDESIEPVVAEGCVLDLDEEVAALFSTLIATGCELITPSVSSSLSAAIRWRKFFLGFLNSDDIFQEIKLKNIITN